MELGADIIRTSDFSWNVSLNGTHYTTKLVDLPKGAIADNNMLPKGTYEANAEGWSTAGSSDAQGGGFYLRGVGRDWYNLYIRNMQELIRVQVFQCIGIMLLKVIWR